MHLLKCCECENYKENRKGRREKVPDNFALVAKNVFLIFFRGILNNCEIYFFCEAHNFCDGARFFGQNYKYNYLELQEFKNIEIR